ncbi:FAD-dependent monooxygenase [Belnapia sp. T6]|uniref:FAD-dependent monooxygenase n=1 Tax=Belnapia mucosa TaxID=2804532 RepID=A0ABS1V568_9PROT|nr:NAD(P)/FAD-dependent oxidoreductase [Belnapia mucosa]MBL6456276.1 FAD-dependent monooxygenase [Belnapia mucosa]
MRIGIIGAGVAGSVLAEMLIGQPGITVDIYDRRQPGEAEETGTGLNVGPNALKALRLHLPARHAALRTASLPWTRWTIALADGAPLFDLPLLEVAEEPGIRLRWAELYRLLREPSAGLTHYGVELVGVEEDWAGRLVPVLEVADGTRLLPRGYDLLVGGDGRYSALRVLTAGAPAPVFHGIAMSRLLVPQADDCPYDDYGQWFNGNARLLSYRLPGGAAYIAGGFPLPSPEAEIPAEAKTAAFQRALYLPGLAEPCPAVAWMAAQLAEGAEAIHWARLQDAPLCRSAAAGRVLFLGDAAHAMVPTLGQGATQAIEDGVIAGALLRRGGGAEDVAAWRDTRIAFVRRFSLEATDTMFPGADPVAGSIAKREPEFLAKLRRLYTDVPGPEEFAPARA